MNKNGNIALTTVIIFSAILVLTGITLILQAIDFGGSSQSYNGTLYAQARSLSCQEEAMYKLYEDSNYTGTITLNFDEGNCQVVVSDIGVDLVKLCISATSEEFSINTVRRVDTSTNPMMLEESQDSCP